MLSVQDLGTIAIEVWRKDMLDVQTNIELKDPGNHKDPIPENTLKGRAITLAAG